MSFPPWVPWWVPVAVLVPALLYGIVFLAMPLSVFGLKSRLDVIEARLDEIQGEIRALVLRLPAAAREGQYEAPPEASTRARREPALPPIPPAPIPPAPIGAASGGVRPPVADIEDREREPVFRAERGEQARRFASDARRIPPPPPPPARRAEPRITWPPPPS